MSLYLTSLLDSDCKKIKMIFRKNKTYYARVYFDEQVGATVSTNYTYKVMVKPKIVGEVI